MIRTQYGPNGKEWQQEEKTPSEGGNLPVVKESRGAIHVAVWENNHRMPDGKVFTRHRFVLERRYKDKQGNWQGTNSLELNDVPKATLALAAAYDRVLRMERED